jgi:hypothetical protein
LASCAERSASAAQSSAQIDFLCNVEFSNVL